MVVVCLAPHMLMSRQDYRRVEDLGCTLCKVRIAMYVCMYVCMLRPPPDPYYIRIAIRISSDVYCYLYVGRNSFNAVYVRVHMYIAVRVHSC